MEARILYLTSWKVTAHNELELLIAPSGVVPVLTFLRDHSTARFRNVVDICAVDVPKRKNRFEVGCAWVHPNIDVIPCIDRVQPAVRGPQLAHPRQDVHR